MKWRKTIWCLSLVAVTAMIEGCHDVLEPKPIDLLVNDVVLNEPSDVGPVEIGLYNAFRDIHADVIVAGDLTADNLIHNGTFSQYRELGIKKITSANASATSLWGNIYNTVYIANFMLERIPEIDGVSATERTRAMSTARFLRGLSYFIGVSTFGGMPLVTTTDITTNRNIPRSSKEEILAFIEADYIAALGKLTTDPPSPAFASDYAVRAALARFYLYAGNWAQAEAYASSVINSGAYELVKDYQTLVDQDATAESILEVGYVLADDPATLNTLFMGRREIIPANQFVVDLNSAESGDRATSIVVDFAKIKGADNGWSVAKYGTAVDNNNDIVVFRLAEMYLIRAESRARLGKVTGVNSAQTDVNLVRARAKVTAVGDLTQAAMLRLIETENRYEFAFEGHRWYDLVRTGRADVVMPAFNSNWKSVYDVWPIPQREIQNNSSLVGNQNPGY